MTTETWTAWIRPLDAGLMVVAIRRTDVADAPWVVAADAPRDVAEYLELRGVLIDPALVPTLDSLRGHAGDDALRPYPESGWAGDHLLRFEVALPIAGIPDEREPVVAFEVDEATYVGDGRDGCYYLSAEGPDGWYVTVVVDSDTGSFVMDMVTDDGPHDTEEHADLVGRDMATTWCIDNGVDYGADDEEATRRTKAASQATPESHGDCYCATITDGGRCGWCALALGGVSPEYLGYRACDSCLLA